MALSESAGLEFQVGDVRVSEAEGTVSLLFSSNGQPLNLGGENKLRWVLLDGEWWKEHQAWRDGCVGWKLFK